MKKTMAYHQRVYILVQVLRINPDRYSVTAAAGQNHWGSLRETVGIELMFLKSQTPGKIHKKPTLPTPVHAGINKFFFRNK